MLDQLPAELLQTILSHVSVQKLFGGGAQAFSDT